MSLESIVTKRASVAVQFALSVVASKHSAFVKAEEAFRAMENAIRMKKLNIDVINQTEVLVNEVCTNAFDSHMTARWARDNANMAVNSASIYKDNMNSLACEAARLAELASSHALLVDEQAFRVADLVRNARIRMRQMFNDEHLMDERMSTTYADQLNTRIVMYENCVPFESYRSTLMSLRTLTFDEEMTLKYAVDVSKIHEKFAGNEHDAAKRIQL